MKRLALILIFCGLPLGAMAQSPDGVLRGETAARVFEQIGGSEFRVEYSMFDGVPLLGVERIEKETPDYLCRMSRSNRPGASPRFECLPSVSGDAQAMFDAIESLRMGVVLTEVHGDQDSEKLMLEKTDHQLLCRRSGAVVANPTFSYQCFKAGE